MLGTCAKNVFALPTNGRRLYSVRRLRHINDGFVCIFDFAMLERIVTSLQNKLHAALFILLPILGWSTIKTPLRLHFFVAKMTLCYVQSLQSRMNWVFDK